jgi:octaprenyl-diphosphate synthase
LSVPSQLAPVTLAQIQRPVRAELDLAFGEISRIVAADFPLIRDVNQHLLALKGKMFRPTLLLLSAQAADSVTPAQITLSAVVELIHVATLVHDDSVDHSVLRRGQPTINALFSHQVAVIMGDFLYSRAIVELARLGDLEALRVVSRVTNDMTVGEMRQLEAHDVLTYSEDDYDALIRAKTASLMSGACEVGALNAEPRIREALRRFGLSLGMAFQVADDVLDYTGLESVTGKPTGLDLREHKITLPLIAALPAMTADERRTVETLMRDPEPAADAVASVIAIVHERNGVSKARERAAQFALEAEVELDVLSDGPAREALRWCLAYAVERRR